MTENMSNDLKLYFAPMEGITGLVCRNAYEACFSGTIDKYFAPFITATSQKTVSSKELRDILPEHNKVPYLVPQILANRADDFIRTAETIVSLGYREINLNLGCPSRTVVTKKKGAGFLEFPHQVDAFLDEVCDWAQKKSVDFSVKTRLGIDEEEEFWELLSVYNKYPLHELIIHPRLQTDYYVRPVHAGVFEKATDISTNPLCYNGDLSDVDRVEKFVAAHPQHDRVMIGRGFLMHPGMGRVNLQGTDDKNRVVSGEVDSNKLARDNLWKFHDAVYEGYCRYIQGDKNMLFKMKELWSYMETGFDKEEITVKKSLKQIRKSQSRGDYESAIRQLRSVSVIR